MLFVINLKTQAIRNRYFRRPPQQTGFPYHVSQKRWRSAINLCTSAFDFRCNTSTNACTVRTLCSIETNQSDGLSSCRNYGQIGQRLPWESLAYQTFKKCQGKYGNRKVLCLMTLYLGTTQLRSAIGEEGRHCTERLLPNTRYCTERPRSCSSRQSSLT
jgi:hypothetical protein